MRDGLDAGEGSPRHFPGAVAFWVGLDGKLLPYGFGEGHKNFTTTWDRVMPEVDDRLVGRAYRVWFCNYWAAQPHELFRFASVLDRAIEAYTKDGVALMPTNYFREPSAAMRRAGMAAYPLMPFVLERLAPSYFQLASNATIWETKSAWKKPHVW